MAAAVVDGAESSQTLKAQLGLRELILGGGLAPGERVPELALVERLGVSRTPVRSALVKLQAEGLLDALPGGGFVVRAFTETEVHDSIELRGTLEGLAARLAAERGVPASLLAELRAAVDAMERAVTTRGRTALYDAVWRGLEYVEQGSHDRKVLVVVSDGADNSSIQSFEEIVKKTQASNVTVFAVAIVDPADSFQPWKRLRDLAEVTGGELFHPNNVKQVNDVLLRIANSRRK